MCFFAYRIIMLFSRYIYLLVVLLTACNGSSDESDGASGGNDQGEDQNQALIQGGSSSSPSSLSLVSKNRISEDKLSNYFVVYAEEGDVLHLSESVNTPLDQVYITRCSASGTWSWGGITVRSKSTGKVVSACNLLMTYTIPDSGEYIVHSWRLGIDGYLRADLVKNGDDRKATIQNAKGGTPSKPHLFSPNENAISKDSFFNYYAYEGKTGDVVNISTYLNYNITGTDRSRCSASGSGNFPFGIKVDGKSGYNCNEFLSYTLKEDGNHVFNLRYMYNDKYDGYFTVNIEQGQ